jgi:hypothetical protein
MALQRINWLQIDSENVPSGSTIDIGKIDSPLHAGYFENLYISGTSIADYIANNPGGGGNGSAGTSGTSGSSGSSGISGTHGTSGTSGLSGADGYFAKWRYRATDDTTTNPGNAYFALNISSWGISPTEIALNDKPFDLNGQSISTYLDSLQIGSILKIVNTNDANNYKLLQITQVSPFEFGYETYGVNQLASNGGDPNNGDIFTITPLGIPGALTLTGDTNNGIITLNGTRPYATVESNMTFDGNTLNVTGSAIVTGSMTIIGDLTVQGKTTLIKNDSNVESLIVSGAMSIVRNQFKSASLSIQNLGTFSDGALNSIIDCGDGFL